MIGINDLNYHMDPLETSQRIYEIARYILASQTHAKISILGILPACYRGNLATCKSLPFFPLSLSTLIVLSKSLCSSLVITILIFEAILLNELLCKLFYPWLELRMMLGGRISFLSKYIHVFVFFDFESRFQNPTLLQTTRHDSYERVTYIFIYKAYLLFLDSCHQVIIPNKQTCRSVSPMVECSQ